MQHVPQWLCAATLLSRCTEYRNLLALGVAGTLLLVLCLGSRRSRFVLGKETVIALAAWAAVVIAFLFTVQSAMTAYLTSFRNGAFGQIAVLKVLDVALDEFARDIALGPAGTLGELG